MIPRLRPASLVATAVVLSALVPAASCKSYGFHEVYMAADPKGDIRRESFKQSDPVYCIASFGNGLKDTLLTFKFRPDKVGGGAVVSNVDTAIVALQASPGGAKGEQTVAAQLPPQALFEVATAASGDFRCIVDLGNEEASASFHVEPTPSKDQDGVPVGTCDSSTICHCSRAVPQGVKGLERCCTADRACGYGYPGTPFCYANPYSTVTLSPNPPQNRCHDATMGGGGGAGGGGVVDVGGGGAGGTGGGGAGGAGGLGDGGLDGGDPTLPGI